MLKYYQLTLAINKLHSPTDILNVWKAVLIFFIFCQNCNIDIFLFKKEFIDKNWSILHFYGETKKSLQLAFLTLFPLFM